MKQGKVMEIRTSADAIKFYNTCINNICKYNYLCLRALSQEKKEIELDLSPATSAWLTSRHRAYAAGRLEAIEHNNGEMKKIEKQFTEPLAKSKADLWAAYLEYKPDTQETFDDVFEDFVFNNDDLNEEYYNYLNNTDENKTFKHEKLFVNLKNYTAYYSAVSKLKMLQQVYNVVCERLTDGGYNTVYAPINSTDDVKAISAETLISFKQLNNQFISEVRKTLKPLEAESYKAYKKVRKNPNDTESAETLDEVSGYIRALNGKLEVAYALEDSLIVLLDRLEASNTSPLGLDAKIVALAADFGFGVTNNKVLTETGKKFVVEHVNAHNSEIADVLTNAIELPAFAPLLQKLAHETDLHTELSAESFEYTKQVLDYLTEDENPDVKVVNNTDDAKKRMVFVTPYGKVWFDGKVLHSFEDPSKTYTVSSLNNYTVNEETGEFLKVELVKPSPTVVVSENNAVSAQSASVSETPSTPVNGRKK